MLLLLRPERHMRDSPSGRVSCVFGRCHRAWRAGLFSAAAVAMAGCGSGSPAASGSSTTSLQRSSTTTSTTTAPVSTDKVPPPSTEAISTTTIPPNSSAPPCRDGQVAVSDSGGGAGLGHEDQVILFTNRSRSSCTLSGYPGVAGLNAQGVQAVQAERTPSGYLGGLQNGTNTPPKVSLAPGQTVSATVEGTDNPVGTATSCPYYPYLLVTPPGFTDSVRVTFTGLDTNPPGLPGCTPIEVHPVVPGSSGRLD